MQAMDTQEVQWYHGQVDRESRFVYDICSGVISMKSAQKIIAVNCRSKFL